MGAHSGSRLKWPAEFMLLPLSYPLVFSFLLLWAHADSYPLPPYPARRNSRTGAHKHRLSLSHSHTHTSPSPHTVPSCCYCNRTHSSPFCLGCNCHSCCCCCCERRMCGWGRVRECAHTSVPSQLGWTWVESLGVLFVRLEKYGSSR